MIALQATTPVALAAAVPAITIGEARKLIARVHRGEPVAASAAIRRVAVDAVNARAHVPTLAVVAERASAIDPFVKYVLATPDGARIEAVRIPLERAGRYVACVSSQVGCALACAYCATGRLGLTRNLEAWEIVEQVRVIRARLPQPSGFEPSGEKPVRGGRRSPARVHGVVFQGMGEPLANVGAVVRAIEVMTDSSALGIDARRITVCTAGLPGGIRRLAEEAPKVRLAISIASAIADVRRRLMPIDRAHALDEVLAAAVEHARATRLAPMWAVTLLEGVNDGEEHARALVERASAFERDSGVRPRISIVAYNAIGEDAFARASEERERAFRSVIGEAGWASHRRYSGGGDVGAACGQLIGEEKG
jgi:23S rRNA (adenine2503-C2)-methyltransferase